MGVVVVKAEQLNLPEHMAEKLKGRKIEILETGDGLLIRPIKGDPIKELKGFLKGRTFTTEDFMRQKQQDKGLEQ